MKESRPLPAALEPKEEEPDEKDKEILRFLAKSGVDRLLSSIASAVGLDRLEAEVRLKKLSEHRYVRLPAKPTPNNPFPEYRLDDKGMEFVVDDRNKG